MAELKRTEIKELLKTEDFGKEINVKGWVRTKRQSKNVAFIAVNDGSTIITYSLLQILQNLIVKFLRKLPPVQPYLLMENW